MKKKKYIQQPLVVCNNVYNGDCNAEKKNVVQNIGLDGKLDWGHDDGSKIDSKTIIVRDNQNEKDQEKLHQHLKNFQLHQKVRRLTIRRMQRIARVKTRKSKLLLRRKEKRLVVMTGMIMIGALLEDKIKRTNQLQIGRVKMNGEVKTKVVMLEEVVQQQMVMIGMIIIIGALLEQLLVEKRKNKQIGVNQVGIRIADNRPNYIIT